MYSTSISWRARVRVAVRFSPLGLQDKTYQMTYRSQVNNINININNNDNINNNNNKTLYTTHTQASFPGLRQSSLIPRPSGNETSSTVFVIYSTKSEEHCMQQKLWVGVLEEGCTHLVSLANTTLAFSEKSHAVEWTSLSTTEGSSSVLQGEG